MCVSLRTCVSRVCVRAVLRVCCVCISVRAHAHGGNHCTCNRIRFNQNTLPMRLPTGKRKDRLIKMKFNEGFLSSKRRPSATLARLNHQNPEVSS